MKLKLTHKTNHDKSIVTPEKVIELILSDLVRQEKQTKDEVIEEHTLLVGAICDIKSLTDLVVHKGLKELLMITFRIGYIYANIKKNYDVQIIKEEKEDNGSN